MRLLVVSNRLPFGSVRDRTGERPIEFGCRGRDTVRRRFPESRPGSRS